MKKSFRDKIKLINLPCLVAIISLIILVTVVCEPPVHARQKETVIIAGTGTFSGVIQIMAESFHKTYPNVIIKLPPSIGSKGAIMALKKGKIDIGMVSIDLKEEEKSGGIIQKPLGKTALVFGVHVSNPVKNLTLEEIEQIYSGTATWPDGSKIRLVLRPRSDSFSKFLADISPNLKYASKKAYSIPGVFLGITDQDAADHIEKIKGSLGTTSTSLVTAEKRKIKMVPINNIAPTIKNIHTGTYPFTIKLSIIYKKNRYKGAAKNFMDFIFSHEGELILWENGIAPLFFVSNRLK